MMEHGSLETLRANAGFPQPGSLTFKPALRCSCSSIEIRESPTVTETGYSDSANDAILNADRCSSNLEPHGSQLSAHDLKQRLQDELELELELEAGTLHLCKMAHARGTDLQSPRLPKPALRVEDFPKPMKVPISTSRSSSLTSRKSSLTSVRAASNASSSGPRVRLMSSSRPLAATADKPTLSDPVDVEMHSGQLRAAGQSSSSAQARSISKTLDLPDILDKFQRPDPLVQSDVAAPAVRSGSKDKSASVGSPSGLLHYWPSDSSENSTITELSEGSYKMFSKVSTSASSSDIVNFIPFPFSNVSHHSHMESKSETETRLATDVNEHQLHQYQSKGLQQIKAKFPVDDHMKRKGSLKKIMAHVGPPLPNLEAALKVEVHQDESCSDAWDVKGEVDRHDSQQSTLTLDDAMKRIERLEELKRIDSRSSLHSSNDSREFSERAVHVILRAARSTVESEALHSQELSWYGGIVNQLLICAFWYSDLGTDCEVIYWLTQCGHRIWSGLTMSLLLIPSFLHGVLEFRKTNSVRVSLLEALQLRPFLQLIDQLIWASRVIRRGSMPQEGSFLQLPSHEVSENRLVSKLVEAIGQSMMQNYIFLKLMRRYEHPLEPGEFSSARQLDPDWCSENCQDGDCGQCDKPWPLFTWDQCAASLGHCEFNYSDNGYDYQCYPSAGFMISVLLSAAAVIAVVVVIRIRGDGVVFRYCSVAHTAIFTCLELCLKICSLLMPWIIVTEVWAKIGGTSQTYELAGAIACWTLSMLMTKLFALVHRGCLHRVLPRLVLTVCTICRLIAMTVVGQRYGEVLWRQQMSETDQPLLPWWVWACWAIALAGTIIMVVWRILFVRSSVRGKGPQLCLALLANIVFVSNGDWLSNKPVLQSFDVHVSRCWAPEALIQICSDPALKAVFTNQIDNYLEDLCMTKVLLLSQFFDVFGLFLLENWMVVPELGRNRWSESYFTGLSTRVLPVVVLGIILLSWLLFSYAARNASSMFSSWLSKMQDEDFLKKMRETQSTPCRRPTPTNGHKLVAGRRVSRGRGLDPPLRCVNLCAGLSSALWTSGSVELSGPFNARSVYELSSTTDSVKYFVSHCWSDDGFRKVHLLGHRLFVQHFLGIIWTLTIMPGFVLLALGYFGEKTLETVGICLIVSGVLVIFWVMLPLMLNDVAACLWRHMEVHVNETQAPRIKGDSKSESKIEGFEIKDRLSRQSSRDSGLATIPEENSYKSSKSSHLHGSSGSETGQIQANPQEPTSPPPTFQPTFSKREKSARARRHAKTPFKLAMYEALLKIQSSAAKLGVWRFLGTCTTLWVDKACINQRDEKTKSAGVSQIDEYLKRSERLLILFSDKYLNRIWCVFELAMFIRKRGIHLCDFVGLDWSSWLNPLAARGEVTLSDTEERLLSNFSCEAADCFDPKDREKLLEKIEVTWGSREAFDLYVRSEVKTAVLFAKRQYYGRFSRTSKGIVHSAIAGGDV